MAEFRNTSEYTKYVAERFKESDNLGVFGPGDSTGFDIIPIDILVNHVLPSIGEKEKKRLVLVDRGISRLDQKRLSESTGLGGLKYYVESLYSTLENRLRILPSQFRKRIGVFDKGIEEMKPNELKNFLVFDHSTLRFAVNTLANELTKEILNCWEKNEHDEHLLKESLGKIVTKKKLPEVLNKEFPKIISALKEREVKPAPELRDSNLGKIAGLLETEENKKHLIDYLIGKYVDSGAIVSLFFRKGDESFLERVKESLSKRKKVEFEDHKIISDHIEVNGDRFEPFYECNDVILLKRKD